jgi:hypothetical protein
MIPANHTTGASIGDDLAFGIEGPRPAGVAEDLFAGISFVSMRL